MSGEPSLVIVGASARAAAFSALRAGLRPWCADQFADVDLQAVCPTVSVARDVYPEGLAGVLAGAPNATWIYTGALENQPALIGRLARLRPLWGNGPSVLRRVRRPWTVQAVLRQAGLPSPRVWHGPGAPRRGRWLVKPLAGGGGRGIAFWAGTSATFPSEKVFLQEYIEGEPCAAVYVGDGRQARLLGVSLQLVGEWWLRAERFHYCGSVGPVFFAEATQRAFVQLGEALAAGFALRGLFGVDCVLRDGIPFPVEINPRYTASIEVLELATGTQALAWHRAVFEGGGLPLRSLALPARQDRVVGKAILFARDCLNFPGAGPWQASRGSWRRFADIPAAGTVVERGQPILTALARAGSVAASVDALRRSVGDLDQWLYER